MFAHSTAGDTQVLATCQIARHGAATDGCCDQHELTDRGQRLVSDSFRLGQFTEDLFLIWPTFFSLHTDHSLLLTLGISVAIEIENINYVCQPAIYVPAVLYRGFLLRARFDCCLPSSFSHDFFWEFLELRTARFTPVVVEVVATL